MRLLACQCCFPSKSTSTSSYRGQHEK
jgi:hypothetical protein